MIEATLPSNVLRELPAADPEFTVEPQMQVPFITSSSLEVFRLNDQTEVQWLAPMRPQTSEGGEGILDKIVVASTREALRHPRSYRAHLNLGVALLNVGIVDRAASEFEEAFRLGPGSVSALAHLARIRLLQGRTTEAQDIGRTIRNVDPSNVIGLLLIASAFVIEGRLGAAVDALSEAIRMAPRNPTPEYLLGVVLIGQGEARAAVPHLRAAARNQPRSAAVQHALGVAYGLHGDLRKAARAFREALTLAPKRRESVLALARVFSRRKATDDVISLLSDWIAAEPQDREVHELLAHSYRETGNHRAARRHLQMALQSIPSDAANARHRARITNNIGVCCSALGDYKDAADWYQKSIQASSTAIGLSNLAKAYRELGNLESARQAVNQSLLINSNDSDTVLLSSAIAVDLGLYDEAIQTLRDVIASGVDNADVYACLGGILSDEKGEYEEASRVLSDGWKRFPGDSSIANNLAYVHLMCGQTAMARQILSAVPETEIKRSVYLTATMGLLRLLEGDDRSAQELYVAAEQLARNEGHRLLAKTVRQKMHLEFARELARRGDDEAAYQHAKRGLEIDGRRGYSDALREVYARLSEA